MGLGSGIQKKPIPDPGSRGLKGIGSGSATLLLILENLPLCLGKVSVICFMNVLLLTAF